MVIEDTKERGSQTTMSAKREAKAIAQLSNGQSFQQPHVLIIGAGITGLVLGQALKEHDIPFTIFERDPDVSARGRGWGLTIHWALQTFLSLLPQHLVDRLVEVYVNPEASKSGENSNFSFFDLHSGEARWKVPSTNRVRVSRERLRALLLDGLDVKVCLRVTYLQRPLTPSQLNVNIVVQDPDRRRASELSHRNGPFLRPDYRNRLPSYWCRWHTIPHPILYPQ